MVEFVPVNYIIIFQSNSVWEESLRDWINPVYKQGREVCLYDVTNRKLGKQSRSRFKTHGKTVCCNAHVPYKVCDFAGLSLN